MKLFDNYLADDLEPLSDKENNLLLELGENAANILRLDEQIQAAEQQIGKIGAVEEEIRQMEKQDFVNCLKTKSQFDQEHELINDTQSQVTNLIDDLVNFLDTHRLNSSKLEEEYIGELPNKEILAELKRAIQEMNNNLKNDMTALHGKIDAIWQSNQPTRNKWRANYEKQNELYDELLRIFRAEGKLLKPEKFVELKNEQRRLNYLAKDTEARNVEIASLREKRSELLIALRHIRKRQYETRNQKAQQLTQELGVKIRISMWPQGHRKIYQEKLEKLFEGTRTRKDTIEQMVNVKSEIPERPAQKPMQYRGETRYLIPEIPCYLDQIDLANAIREERVSNTPDSESPLALIFGISSERMRQNIASLTPEKIFELETLEIPDLPVIELQVSSGEFGYKPLHSLSVGQKCTALLSMVLLENPAPLLIDQPEDDLDNHFIFDQIVTTLRKAKERRQFIIATHNANIPVSGDAELILVLQANDQNGWIDEGCIGSIQLRAYKTIC